MKGGRGGSAERREAGRAGPRTGAGRTRVGERGIGDAVGAGDALGRAPATPVRSPGPYSPRLSCGSMRSLTWPASASVMTPSRPWPTRNVDLARVRLALPPRDEQHGQTGVPGGVADGRFGADAPAADDRDADLVGRAVVDGGKSHDRHLGAGGVPETTEQIFHRRLRGGVDDRREVVHVPDGLRREELRPRPVLCASSTAAVSCSTATSAVALPRVPLTRIPPAGPRPHADRRGARRAARHAARHPRGMRGPARGGGARLDPGARLGRDPRDGCGARRAPVRP